MDNQGLSEESKRMVALGEKIITVCQAHITSRPNDGFGEAMAALGYAWGRQVADIRPASADSLFRAIQIAADSISGHIQNRWYEIANPKAANDGG